MANISLLSRLVNGVQRQVDLSSNTLVLGGMQLKGSTSGSLTQTANPTTTAYSIQWPAAVAAAAGYVLSSDTAGNLSWVSAAAGSALDGTFRIENSADNTKQIAFSAAGISSGQTRTITMPDANVDLGNLTNSNISATAAIAYSKLSLAGSILNSDINTSAAIAYSKLNLAGSILNSDINASAAIAYSKLNLSASVQASDQNSGAATATQPLFATGSGAAAYRSILSTDLPSLSSIYLALTGGTMSGAIAMGGNKITALAPGVAGTDAINLNQLQNAIAGTNYRPAVSLYDNVDTTLPATTATLIDGVTVTNGMRVLFVNLASNNNEVYVATVSGSSISWAAALDLDRTSAAPVLGDSVNVLQGTTYADSSWVYNGTQFAQFNGGTQVQPGNALSKTGNTLNVNYDNSTISLDGSNHLYVPSGGIGSAQLAAGSVLAGKLGTVTDGITLDQLGSGGTLEVKAGGISNLQISGSAAIAYSKLNLSGSILNSDINASAAIAYSKLNLSGSIVNSDINASAAIAYSKLSLSNSIQKGDITTGVFDQVTITGGNGTAASVASSPTVQFTEVAGQAFSANITYAVRYGLPSNGETAGRIYAADITTSSFDLFWVIGFIQPTSAVAAAANVNVISDGVLSLLSGDTAFSSTDPGKAIFLQSGGTQASTTAPSTSGQAVAKLGIVKTTSSFRVQISSPYVA